MTKAMLDSMTTDISDTQIQCPEPQCNKFEWIVDNEKRKAVMRSLKTYLTLLVTTMDLTKMVVVKVGT